MKIETVLLAIGLAAGVVAVVSLKSTSMFAFW